MKNIRFINQLLALVIVVVLLVLGACSSAPTSSSTPILSSKTPTPTSTATPTTTLIPTSTSIPSTPTYTVKTASKAGIGDYLVDGKGMTLYYFTKDVIGKSTATGNVLAAWPIFNPADFEVSSSLKATDFSTITRDDGQKQATYNGWPLYYYAKDKASGDTLGEAVGGVWFVMKVPFYTVMLQTKTDVGNYLVDSKGRTLYWTTRDVIGQSNITGTTLANWPVFNVSNSILVSTLKSSDLGSISRADGSMQTTYKGWPLYYYIKDQASGDTLGQGVAGVWFVVNPTATAPPSPTTTTSTSSATTATSTTSTTTTTTSTATGGTPVTINLVAQAIAFDTNSISVPAGASVTINFNNKDTVPHNFSLYTDSSATPPAIFQGQIVTGPATVTYNFKAPTTPGTYFFRCDIHPTIMTGSFIVTAVSSGGGGSY
jgi:predicted lipoprotein with Yx(FWY)xxD motif/plastocyanin